MAFLLLDRQTRPAAFRSAPRATGARRTDCQPSAAHDDRAYREGIAARAGGVDSADDWGGGRWWRLDRFHQVRQLPDSAHADGAAPSGGAGSVVKPSGLT
jgi:hypothetical protein